MTKEEMKLVKFETMINDLYRVVFNQTKGFRDKNDKIIQPAIILFGQESDNSFIKIVNKTSSQYARCNWI